MRLGRRIGDNVDNELILYHGTNVWFEKADLEHSKDRRDFGKGFYTTTRYDQALEWAENMYIRYGGKGVYVMKFKLYLHPDLNIKVFRGLTREWLTMIKENRLIGGLRHGYDIVIGPLADDNTMRTVALYVAGIYTDKVALELLKTCNADDQVSIHTTNGMKCLEYMEHIWEVPTISTVELPIISLENNQRTYG